MTQDRLLEMNTVELLDRLARLTAMRVQGMKRRLPTPVTNEQLGILRAEAQSRGWEFTPYLIAPAD